MAQKQPDGAFLLFTVDFTATAVGASVLGGRYQAVDPFGQVFDGRFRESELPGGRLVDAEIEVKAAGDDPAEVPAPSSLWLFAVGLFGGVVRRRR